MRGDDSLATARDWLGVLSQQGEQLSADDVQAAALVALAEYARGVVEQLEALRTELRREHRMRHR